MIKSVYKMFYEFFLDIAKAFYIGTFVTPLIIKAPISEVAFSLTKGIFGVTIYLILAIACLKKTKKYERTRHI